MAGRAGKLTASLSRPLLPPQDDAGISLWHPADVPAAGKGLLDRRPAMKLASGGTSDRNGCFGRARQRRCRQRSIAEQPHSEPAWPMHAENSMKRILSLLLPALLALSILACTAVQAEPGSVAEQREAVQLLSHLRARHGLAPLKWTPDSDLQAAAMVRAREITRMFSHARPDGQSFESAMGEAGIAYRRFGENIASGTRMDAAGATRGWEHSPGHRGNMLSRDFKEVGIALWREGRKAYWVQLFLTRR